MKKMMLAATTFALLTGSLWAQDLGKDITPPVIDPVTEEFNNVINEWLAYNNMDKEAAYSVLSDLESKIREDFPMDAATQKALQNLADTEYKQLSALANELGYDNFKDAIEAGHPRAGEFEEISKNFHQQRDDLTRAYNEEFQRRYHTTCIDALERLMENGQAMK
ncbi:MAG: hypothetical protein JW863_22440 [Chitinispirillaceae bacterium]|nr:hypothetical protein [Chitinispirillaceae bacterium]